MTYESSNFLTAPRFPKTSYLRPQSAPVGSLDTPPITCFVTHVLPRYTYKRALVCKSLDPEALCVEEKTLKNILVI